MAITDRNLAAGTKLWARYKGATHTAEVVAHADEKGNETTMYRLADGREFKSPSAAGGAVFGEGRTCNGWSFWTVGEPTEKAARTSPTARQGGTVNAVPKPTSKRSRRKEPARDGNGEGLPIVEQSDGFECGECGQSFPTQEEAAKHLEEAHATGPQPAGD